MKTPQADSVENLKELYAKRKDQTLQDYLSFLRFKSISSESEYKQQVHACAIWLARYLENLHFDTQIWETEGHPIIFASHLEAGPDKPTLLIYNHYDVQPVDPLNLWDSPPFDPTIKHGEVYARGAQDNKGQCFYVITALKLLLERDKKLPINVKLIIEGEEECGSDSLSNLLKSKKKKEQLQADYLAVVDVGLPGPNIPSVTLGTRGLVTMDVEVQGSFADLHSGSHGGLAFNPIHALVRLLGKLHDDKGKVAVPGFYEHVTTVEEKEKQLFSTHFDAEDYQKKFGAAPTGGERHLPPLDRNWFRPTLEINGINGGYSGGGFKTVIPAKAIAKLSCRLVPYQDPAEIGRLVAHHLQNHAPEGVVVKVHVRSGSGSAVRINPSSDIAQAFAKAFTDVLKVPCQFILSGATIPIAQELAAASESDLVFVGFGLDDDQIHAPNEHFGIDRFENGVLMICRALEIIEHLNNG